MQYVKFPMSTLRITQGYGLPVDGVGAVGTYSHTGAYALDLGGADGGAEYLYAPCDVKVVRHYVGSGYNAVWYQTIAPVMCADGQSRELVFMLLHANDSAISELGITVGKTFAQGQAFYKEGTGGGVATHCHLEVGLAPFTGTGWFKSSYTDDRGVNVWIINNKLIPSEIFYLTSETNVVEDMGYNWRYLTTNYTEYNKNMGIRVIAAAGVNVQYFNTPNADDIAGNYLPTGSEYKALGYTTTPDSYGLTYTKFILDGSEYWMANVSDRCETYEIDPYILYTTTKRVKTLLSYSGNIEFFNSPDVNNVAGTLEKGKEYEALGYVEGASYNFIAFVYDDGKTYYMVELSDRIELYDYIEPDILNHTYFLRANNTELYLNVHGNDTVENERNVNVYAKEDVFAQRWVFKQTSAGLKLHTKINEAFALNIYTIDNNCSVYTAEDNDVDSIIELEQVSDNSYKIKMVSHDKYLNIEDNNAVWATTGATWTFIPEEEAYPNESEDPSEFSEYGIDVSDHQGVIDWGQVAATENKFALLKAVGSTSEGVYIQNYWEYNYSKCKENGLKVGAYLYTYAFNDEEAEVELEYLLQALNGKQFEYPIFIDVEDPLLYQNCSKEVITNTTKYLCSRLEQEGYYAAVYTYAYFANAYLNMDELSEYDVWIADYDSPVDYKGKYTIWQYTSQGSVNGIDGNVDLNISYVDYEPLIKSKGKNGFMAIQNTEMIKARIRNKYDTYDNWVSSGLILESGEIAIAHTTANISVDGQTIAHPALLMKVGNGEKVFNDLPWLSAKAFDVIEACKSEDALIEFISSVTDEEITSIKTTLQTLNELVGNTSVNSQIESYVNGLNLAQTYEAKGEAQKVRDELESYKLSNNEAVSQNTNAITAINNRFDELSEIAFSGSTDDLIMGENVLLINGNY